MMLLISFFTDFHGNRQRLSILEPSKNLERSLQPQSLLSPALQRWTLSTALANENYNLYGSVVNKLNTSRLINNSRFA